MSNKLCPYDGKCYRKNPDHFKEYFHTSKTSEINNDVDTNDDTVKLVVKKAKLDIRCDSILSDSNKEDIDIIQSESFKESIPEFIKSKYLVEMPQDFYDFFLFAKTIDELDPLNAFYNSLSLKLVGPFDILSGKHKIKCNNNICYHRHWRYYYDPPEFLTVVKGNDDTQFHMGYYRDVPKDLPSFVGFNEASKSCEITCKGENLFAAFKIYIDSFIKKKPPNINSLDKLRSQLEEFAKTKSYTLEIKTNKIKLRDKNVVSKTFHNAGIVVPVDENEVGYRPLPETNSKMDLKKIFKKIVESKTDEERNKHFDPLMEIITCIQFANDECDYGEGLELGLDLFSYGYDVFHSQIINILSLAYEMLDRNEYGVILKAHLENRSKNVKELDQFINK